ncbi:hypothetical protein QK289_15470 [Exiguobacterium antarcticum]|uniref:Uncharacterized protein n=1 Tax=Exiguobacterium antarcticum TaxID=132920 RepID=A0ABT6R7Y3_9BACL|nr:hypothetical protein [Exiguobacterium antarcticum]MDI3236414.1 hypothetical protein [Exiguobacterium antarcticum]
MSYPPKSYKVNPLFQVLYYSIYEVLNQNKPHILEYSLDKVVGKDERIRLSRFGFNELFIDMVNQFEKALQEDEYDEVILRIDMNERTSKLRKAYVNTPFTPEILTANHFRIPPTTIRQVQKLKRETLREVVEQSTLHYVTLLTEMEYKLVCEVFDRYLVSGRLFK